MSEQREFIRAQLSSGVDYYKGEKGDKPVKGVDYFTPADIESIVEQIEAGHIDFSAYATKEYVDDAIENIDITETDPTVPAWAKAENKPTYTASEVGALPDDTALFSGNYNDLSNKPTIPVVPTNVSSFTNDAGYLTQHQSLSDYATKSYVEQVVAGIETGALKRSVVQSLPVSNIDENTIYMVARSGASGTDIYDEYLRVNNAWEKIGSTQVDLTNYALKSELFSGSYNDLTDKPTIPAAYTLPTASTSTLGGVKVDGTTITISDGVISSVGGGSGSSYTAGRHIKIDSDVVSWNGSMIPDYGGLGWNYSSKTKAEIIELLKNGEMVYNPSSSISLTASDLVVGGKLQVIGPVNTSTGLIATNTMNNNSTITLTSDYYYYFMPNKRTAGLSSYDIGGKLFIASNGDFTALATYNVSDTTRNKTMLYLDKNKQDKLTAGTGITISSNTISADSQLPATPSNDGTYFLKNVVSSGVATQSWENVVIGGSY